VHSHVRSAAAPVGHQSEGSEQRASHGITATCGTDGKRINKERRNTKGARKPGTRLSLESGAEGHTRCAACHKAPRCLTSHQGAQTFLAVAVLFARPIKAFSSKNRSEDMRWLLLFPFPLPLSACYLLRAQPTPS
jgi:hypothetical protein